MSNYTISKICFVVASLVLINTSTMAAMNNESIDRQVLAESSISENKSLEDDILDDVVMGKVEKLKQFLDRSGSPNRYLYAAINSGQIDCVKLMLDRGANVNLPGDEGVTPLMTSVRVTYRNGLEITQLLIKRGANINAIAGKGSTALMYAAWGVANHYEDDYVHVAKFLLQHGAKVNVQNKMGDSPLSIAKRGNWKKIVMVLKKAGAKF
jgi:uncharacterized protein